MDRDEIERYLQEVGAELAADDVTGDIVIVGGAYMTLVLRSREVTRDVDAYLDPATAAAIRQATEIVADRHGLPKDWLNDAVKGFFATSPTTVVWAEYPGLRVNAVTADYIFAMKALAARPQDAEDLRALAAHLGIPNAEAALEIVGQHVPDRLLTPKTRYLLEELFEEDEP